MEIRVFQPNSPFAAPDLIKHYIGSLEEENKETPDHLRLFIDGILTRNQRAFLKTHFSRYFESVIIKNIIKRNKVAARRKKGKKTYRSKSYSNGRHFI